MVERVAAQPESHGGSWLTSTVVRPATGGPDSSGR